MCQIEQEFFPGEDWFEWIARHRAARECRECELPIPAGVKHVVVFHGPFESAGLCEWTRFFLHRECDRLSDKAAELVCGESGVYGEMLEHLDYLDQIVVDPSTFPYDYVDPEDAAELLLEYEAIEHRYDGLEREIGGES